MNFTIYNIQSGEILKIVICPESELQYQFNAQTETYYPGDYQDNLYYFQNNQPVQKPPQPDWYYVFDIQTKQWVADVSLLSNSILENRNKLLYQSDWTQIPGNPLTPEKQQEWAVYRQQLRDITTQPGYPFNVVWPTQPE